LGNGFTLENLKGAQRILLIGGGIGVPPLYYLGRKLKAQGHSIEAILGFNSAKDVFYEKQFKELGKLTITTIDGSSGKAGLVTDYIEKDNFDILFTCGPTPMLKAIQQIIPKDKLAFMSLEERMGCGIGACLACVCQPQTDYQSPTGYIRACTEGPVFRLHDIKL